MTTSTVEVRDLFSILDAHGIEKHLRRLAGVARVSVNPVSGSTTIMYDPATTNLAAIAEAIERCGFHCAGEALPKHDHSSAPKVASSGPEAPVDEVKPERTPARKQPM